MESEFLSTAESKATLPLLLEQIYDGLSRHGECRITLTPYMELNLKSPFVSRLPHLQDVHDWDVPYPIVPLHTFKSTEWDLAMSRTARYMDGTHSVKRIAQLADMDLALVHLAVQHFVCACTIFFHILMC